MEREDRDIQNTLLNGKVGTAERIYEEVLEGVPVEKREIIERMLTVQSMRISGIDSDMAISEKLTSEHITKVLDGSLENMRCEYNEKKNKRKFSLIILIVIIIAMLTVILVLKDLPDLMEKIVLSISSLGAGFLGGYGIGKKKEDD